MINLLLAEKVTKKYGEKVLFKELTFGIAEGEKAGLIGINGTGKSTLLKILIGREEPDEGKVIYAGNTRIGYLPQNPFLHEQSTVLEEVIQGSSPVMKLIRDYEELVMQAEHSAEPTLQKQLLQLGQKMDEANAWQVESEAKTILTRLGIVDFQVQVGTLSGGQRKRVALAAALINPVELLIMDEPTNHIDDQTVDWLEQYLKERKGALLMVTHDRYFLDRVAGRIFELNEGKIYSYSGNYSFFLEKKAEREELEQTLSAKRQNFYRRELGWIKRGAKARSTKQQARIDRFEALQDQMTQPNDRRQMEVVASSSRLGKKVITLKHLEKNFGDKRIIHNFDYMFSHADRLGIIGPNGAGKSTLLNLIAGNLKPDHGLVETGPTVKIGFFSQEYVELDENQRVIDYIKAQAEHLPTADGGSISAAQLLERFLFPPALQWAPIAKLSGGELRRLFLLRILMGAPNVLLLDEPTNDLDTQTLSILEDYLEEFPGVVIAASHDRYFLDRVVDKLLIFEGEAKVSHFVGNYSEYREYLTKQLNTTPVPIKILKPENEPKRSKDKPLKMSFKEQRELAEIDHVIAGVEQELAEVKARINQAGSDYLLLQELTGTQEKLEQRLNELMERWAYLNELLEEIAKHKA